MKSFKQIAKVRSTANQTIMAPKIKGSIVGAYSLEEIRSDPSGKYKNLIASIQRAKREEADMGDYQQLAAVEFVKDKVNMRRELDKQANKNDPFSMSKSSTHDTDYASTPSPPLRDAPPLPREPAPIDHPMYRCDLNTSTVPIEFVPTSTIPVELADLSQNYNMDNDDYTNIRNLPHVPGLDLYIQGYSHNPVRC